MVQKRTAERFLLAFAALAVAVEFVGFISPGWLCMSVKHQHQADDFDKSLLVGNSSNKEKSFKTDDVLDSFRRQSKVTNKADKDSTKDDKESTKDDKDSTKAEKDSTKADKDSAKDETDSTKAEKDSTKAEKDSTKDYEEGKNRIPRLTGTNSSSSASAARQEERVYRRFRKWVYDNKYNLSLPVKSIDFTQSLIMFRNNDRDQFLAMKDYLKKFMNYIRSNDVSLNMTVIRSWISIPTQNPLPVNSRVNATVYRQFKQYVERTSPVKLPNLYRDFIKWLAQDSDRIQNMTTRFQGFMRKIANADADDTKYKKYSAVIKSWVKQALNYQDENQAAEWLGSSAFDAGMERRVNLGLWYGEECVTVTGNAGDKCSNTNVVRMEEKGFDVGGTSTWVDLRMESTFALCAGVVGLVGTFLTVKPFCLKGRRKVTLIVGMSGLFLSCILFLVPIIRVASINSALKNSYRDENEALRVQMPWAAVVSGIGACIACVTAGLLAVFTWADEKQIWNKFVDDPPIAFINDVKVNKMDVSGNGEKDGTYDNLATMKNV